jgi:hypothetical protein
MARRDPIQIDTANWSGDGDLTTALCEALKQVESIAFLRIEDAPAGRADTGYNFLANEIYVGFRLRRAFAWRRLGRLPVPAIVVGPDLTLAGLETRLAEIEGIGPPDYSDEAMLQYLRTERVIPPWQTRGHKIVELVRVYELTAVRR